MGKRLRTLRKTVKDLVGSGRVTDVMIDKIQNYYGIAIRNTGKDCDTMKKSIWAAFYHVASSNSIQFNLFHSYNHPMTGSGMIIVNLDQIVGSNIK